MIRKIRPQSIDANACEKSYRAMMSNSRGKQFEMMIEGGCRYYKSKGIAKIEKTPEPFRCLKKNRQTNIATVRFTAHAEPDFIGSIYGGKALAFEAKYTDTDRIRQDVVTKTQARALEDYSTLGAYAGVCIGIRDDYFMLPWKIFSNMKNIYGRKYVTSGDITSYKIKFDGIIRFLEYANKEISIETLQHILRK